LGTIGNVAAAARLSGLRLYLAVYNPGGSSTPLTDEAQDDFASYAAAVVRAVPYIHDVIVGNEPNLNQFWLPQFDEDGGDTAPRGGDNPLAQSKTHSPTTFIRDLGTAYRDSGRTRPLMDAFAIHPYEQNSSQPPATRNGGNKSIAIADYDKLVRLLGTAFDGT